MLESIAKLFELATHYPAITEFRIHREPDTADCTNIESIGVNVRTVNVEFIRYKHCSVPQTLVLIHCPDRGPSRFLHNDQNLCHSQSAGQVLYKLIAGDLAALVSDAEHDVFLEGAKQLEASNAIRKSAPAVTRGFADRFIHRTSAGSYATVSEFLNDAKVPQ